MKRSIAAVLIGVLGISAALAQSPWKEPVGRKTVDVAADLILALIKARQFDDAEEICAAELKQLDPGTDAAALWANRLSQVRVASALMTTEFSDALVVAAQQPIMDLLSSQPDHPRRLFLEAQKLTVVVEAARHAVVIASVSPSDQARIEQVSDRLGKVTLRIKDLITQVDQRRAVLDTNVNSPRNQSIRDDAVRLQQELQVSVVSMALLQTELSKPKSVDHISAAKRAEMAADSALLQLRNDTQARREVSRLRIKAILSGEQPELAARELSSLAREYGQPVPASLLALKMQIDLAQGAASQAEKRMASIERAGVSSIELDLTRLQIMLARQNPRVGDWLDEIEKRHGVFVRRRAEAISLSGLTSSSAKIDPAIIAAQGQDWLRRNEPARAAQLLAAAADAEQKPDRALQRAAESAAAFLKADDPKAAAKILQQISIAQSTGDKAAAVHLQSAFILSKFQAASADQLIDVLDMTIQKWPTTPQATQARGWSIKILSAQGDWLAAASVATNLSSDLATEQELQTARRLWIQAIRNAKDDKASAVSTQFADESKALIDKPAFRQAAAIVLDVLDGSFSSKPNSDRYEDQLLAYRVTPGRTLSQPSDAWSGDTVWRLMRDGRINPLWRKPNAGLIESWKLASADAMESAERKIWLGDVAAATNLVRTVLKESDRPGKDLRRAASIFSNSDNQEARSQAIKFLDQLSAGLRKGSGDWHKSKIDAIELLRKTGNAEEAKKRAKYILLTDPPTDNELKQRYESLR